MLVPVLILTSDPRRPERWPPRALAERVLFASTPPRPRPGPPLWLPPSPPTWTVASPAGGTPLRSSPTAVGFVDRERADRFQVMRVGGGAWGVMPRGDAQEWPLASPPY